jgi:hypothetical protein
LLIKSQEEKRLSLKPPEQVFKVFLQGRESRFSASPPKGGMKVFQRRGKARINPEGLKSLLDKVLSLRDRSFPCGKKNIEAKL